MPILTGKNDSVRDFPVTAHHNEQWSIRTKDWSYLLPIRGDRKPELYNRKTDRAEHNNVLNSNKETADALELCLRRFAHQMDTFND